MNLPRRIVFAALPTMVGLLSLGACSAGGATVQVFSAASSQVPTSAEFALDLIARRHDADHKVYYQLGPRYVTTSQTSDYETLGIYVPGVYFTGEDNDNGTYTVAVSASGAIGSSTAATAPTVFPVNTPGHSAQRPPTEHSYDAIKAHVEASFIHVYAGLRGKDSNSQTYSGNASWSVIDLKAIVRCRRYNSTAIPDDAAKVYVFGHSGGGAQSAAIGASRDSEPFAPYLAILGAAAIDTSGKALSDAAAGTMCWCLITSLDSANVVCEWNMEQLASSDTRVEGTQTRAYSQDLAATFPTCLNGLKFADVQGKPPTLESSFQGTYLSGSYYSHLVLVIQKSLSDLLVATIFPYTPSSAGMAGMEPSGDDEAPSKTSPSDAGGTPPKGGTSGGGSQDSAESTTCKAVEKYIALLNSSSQWITYDASKKTATITELQGFITSQKNTSKDIGALNGVGYAQTKNLVVGSGENKQHFSSLNHEVISKGQSRYSGLSGQNKDYGVAACEKDLAAKDSVGTDMVARVMMYDPLYYLTQGSKGQDGSTIAPAWRVRTDITQDDTASIVEVNLALAFQQAGAGNIDFATIWGQRCMMAELTSTNEEDFVAWMTKQAF